MSLADKLTQITCLYGIKLAIRGETKPSSSERLVDYIGMISGQEAVKGLARIPHANLRLVLKKYNIVEIE